MMYSRGLVLVLVCSFFLETYSNCNKNKCKTARIHGLQASDCYNMNLKEFPNCLSSDIEVVDLSYNRIRKLSRSDFEKHPYIRHLYLADNLIVNIEDDIFVSLDRLETLDLSLNALGRVPKAIFQLPSLKTLYLSQNSNLNVSEAIQDAQPISSPLTKLDISMTSSESDPKEFPDFGVMPYLAVLNITGNSFTYLLPKHFAGLCNLQVLASINATAYFKSPCDCNALNNWLEERNVRFTKFYCNGNTRDCPNQQLDPEDVNTYKTCQGTKDKIQQSQLLTKIGIGIGVVFIIVLVIAVITIWKLRKNKKSAQAKVSYYPVKTPT